MPGVASEKVGKQRSWAKCAESKFSKQSGGNRVECAGPPEGPVGGLEALDAAVKASGEGCRTSALNAMYPGPLGAWAMFRSLQWLYSLRTCLVASPQPPGMDVQQQLSYKVQ